MKRVCIAACVGAVLLWPAGAGAHCDSMDGPVVKAAQRALEREDLNEVLIWIAADDEGEIRAAFAQTLVVRKLDARARALADRYFFETVVRVHRAGEGEPYTGLQPAGRDLGPVIPLADRALEDGTPAALQRLIASTVETGLHQLFEEALAAKTFQTSDVAAGRRFVRAYVEFLHYAERVFEAGRVEHGGHLHATPK